MDSTLTQITTLMKEQKILDQELIGYLGLPCGAFANGRRDNENAYYRYIRTCIHNFSRLNKVKE